MKLGPADIPDLRACVDAALEVAYDRLLAGDLDGMLDAIEGANDCDTSARAVGWLPKK